MVLSPLLFNIYVKLLGEVVRRSGLCRHLYADDTQLYLKLPSDPREGVERLGRGLKEVMGWMRAYKLRLKPKKMEVLLVGPDKIGLWEVDVR